MTAGANLKVPGVELQLNGTTYVVPPLNAAAVKQHREKCAAFFASGVPDIDTAVVLLHAALQRNYPGLTIEQVEEMVDYGNLVDVMDTVMHTSGLALAVGNLSRRIQQAMNPPAASTTSSPT